MKHKNYRKINFFGKTFPNGYFWMKRPVEVGMQKLGIEYYKPQLEKYFDVRIKGLSNIPLESAMITPNHAIGIDGMILTCSFSPRPCHFLIQKEGLYDSSRMMRFGFWLIGEIPVSINGDIASNYIAVRRIRDYVRKTKDLIFTFAEGPTKDLIRDRKIIPIEERKHYLGAAAFALRTGRPIVPIGIKVPKEVEENLFEFNRKDRTKRDYVEEYVTRNGRIPYCVNIGKPIDSRAFDRESLSYKVKKEVIELYNN